MFRFKNNLIKRKTKVFTVATVAAVLLVAGNARAQFTAGNLVVELARGTGSAGSPISLLEYTTSGTLVSTDSLPSTGTTKITISGSASSEGLMSMSAERDRLVIVGYDAAAGTSSVASTSGSSNNREIFTVDRTGSYTKVASTSSLYSGNNIRGGTFYGNNYWTTGPSTGVAYDFSTTIASLNTRFAAIFNGKLYVSNSSTSASCGVDATSTSLPTSSSTFSQVINLGAGSSAYSFSFSPDGNTCYVADDGAGSSTTYKGISKWTKSGSTWSWSYNLVGSTANIRGLTVDYSGTNPVIYFTTTSNLYKLTDAGSSSTASSIATPSTGSFRNVTWAPSCFATITNTGSSTFCGGGSTTIKFSGNPYASVAYTVNGTADTIVLDSTGNATLNTGYVTSTTTYSLVSVTTNACSAYSITGSVTFTNEDASAIAGTTTVCVGSTTTLSDSTTGGAWSSSDTTIAKVDATTGVVTGIATGTATITYIVTTLCGSSLASVGITVSPLPTVSAISGASSVCAGSAITLTDTTSGGTWRTADSAIATVSSGVVTGVSPGTDTIFYTYTSGCSASVYKVVAVNGPPTIGEITGSTGVCVSSTTTLSDTTSGGIWASSDPSIASVDPSTGVVTGEMAGSVAISYAVTGTCGTDTVYATVTVGTIAPIDGASSVCAGSTTTLTDATTSGTWSSSDTSIARIDSATGVVTGVDSGTVTITYTVITSCGAGSVTTPLSVTPHTSVAPITGIANVCAGSTTTLSDVTTGGTWSTSDASIATVTGGAVFGVSGGTAVISYAYTGTCGTATTTDTVTINALPTAGISGSTTISSGSSATIFFTGTPNATVTYNVNGGSPLTVTLDASGSYSLSVSPAATSTYSITSVTSTTGCTQTVSGSATVTLVYAYTYGYLVVSHPTAGGSGTSSGITLAEYKTDGTFVDSVNLPSSGTNRITMSGSATSEGRLSLSAERDRLMVAGYDANAGTSSIAGTSSGSVNRVLFEVNSSGFYTKVGSTGSLFSGNNVRCGTAKGSAYFAVGANTGVGYMTDGTTVISSSVTNERDIAIYNGQLYTSSGSGSFKGLNKVGTGIPTSSGATTTNLFSTSHTGNMYGFSISPDGNTAYIADATSGIVKFTKSGSTWSEAYVLNSTPAAGIAVDFSTSTIYATTFQTTSSAPDSLIKVVDGGSAGATLTLLATATSNITPFRGLSFVPSCNAAIATSGATTFCPGSSTTINFSGNPYGVVAFTVNGASASITLDSTGSATFNTGPLSTTTVYSLESITTTACSAASVSGSVTITILPEPSAGTILGPSSVCMPYSVTLTDAASGGTWSSADSTIATVSSTGMVSGVSVGSTSIIYSVTSTCGTAYDTLNVTVNESSADSLTGPSLICSGSGVTTVTFGGGAYDTIHYSIDGSSSFSAVLDASGHYTVSASLPEGVTTYVLESIGSYSGCTILPSSDTLSINSVAAGTWLGNVSTDWNDGSNWSCGAVPDGTVTVTIPSGTTYSPAITSGTDSCDSINIASGAVLTISGGASLAVNGEFNNNGQVTGDGVVVLEGSSAQTITGTGFVNNLELNNSSGASIATDTCHIVKTLTLASGTLQTNNLLLLYSDANGTARIGEITGGAITGNVTCQQYTGVPGTDTNRRAFRFFGHPFTGSLDMSSLQDNIDVTGHGGSANGFTDTYTDNPSAFYYDTYTGDGSTVDDVPGWKAFANTVTDGTDSTTWRQFEGIRVLVRGVKGVGLWGEVYTPAPVTIDFAGTVNTGSLSVPMRAGSTSTYNLLGNPYPSPVDIGSVISNASIGGAVAGPAYWVWNPYAAIKGAYETYAIDGTPYYLPSYGAFEVEAAYDGAALSFTESDKGLNPSEVLAKTTSATDMVSLHIFDTSYRTWDRLYIRFNSSAASSFETSHDAGKLHNTDLDFYSYSSDGRRLCFDTRPFTADSIIPLGIGTDVLQSYIMKADVYNMPADARLYLHDKYLGTYTLLNLGTVYPFSITTDTASQGNRFEISMAGDLGLAGKNPSMQVTVMPNPATDNVIVSYNLPATGKTSLRITNTVGQQVYAKELGTQQSGSVTVDMNNMPSGIYLVTFSQGEKLITQRLVKE